MQAWHFSSQSNLGYISAQQPCRPATVEEKRTKFQNGIFFVHMNLKHSKLLCMRLPLFAVTLPSTPVDLKIFTREREKKISHVRAQGNAGAKEMAPVLVYF